MEFEFDPWKSESNKAKHGIDFVEAQALWKSKCVILGAKDAAEKRYLVIGTSTMNIGPRLSPIAGREFRIISVRKSSVAEIETYEKIAR